MTAGPGCGAGAGFGDTTGAGAVVVPGSVVWAGAGCKAESAVSEPVGSRSTSVLPGVCPGAGATAAGVDVAGAGETPPVDETSGARGSSVLFTTVVLLPHPVDTSMAARATTISARYATFLNTSPRFTGPTLETTPAPVLLSA